MTCRGSPPLTIRAHTHDTLAFLKNTMTIGKIPAYHPRGLFLMCNQVGMIWQWISTEISGGQREDPGSCAVLDTTEDAIDPHQELGVFPCRSDGGSSFCEWEVPGEAEDSALLNQSGSTTSGEDWNIGWADNWTQIMDCYA